MSFETNYPQEDADVADPLESRHFYELCQAYRHALIGVQEFETLKDWIRSVQQLER